MKTVYNFVSIVQKLMIFSLVERYRLAAHFKRKKFYQNEEEIDKKTKINFYLHYLGTRILYQLYFTRKLNLCWFLINLFWLKIHSFILMKFFKVFSYVDLEVTKAYQNEGEHTSLYKKRKYNPFWTPSLILTSVCF